ncbi:cadherin-like domain-containing protein [Ahrensia sp. R2A130]|uniref:cadherin-like domain-containing protein n=1 Tax=Ahrensia sp. R2A130 TaxID=744979 RepID=UPI0001E0CA40|nr:cadherin-like domain-containing protein [Ahrensia sp. R2A130]EFL87626.1 Na-Ca exchanger/integrin-beta4 [Ahrensia sp. R2A130]
MEFEVTNEDTGDTRETGSVIAELPNGNLLVAWTQFASSQTNGRTSGVRVIEADGTPVSNELFPSGLVPSGDTLSPTILAISDTKFLIVEAVFDSTSFAFTLSGHVLTLNGSTLSSGPAIDLTPTGEFSNGGPELALTDSGKVILATSVTPDGNNPTVEIAVLDDNLNVLTPFTQIGERDTNSPGAIHVDTNGETVVVTWTQNNIGNTQTPALGQTVTIAGDGSIAPFTRVDHVLRADDALGHGLRDTLVLDNGNVVILTNGGPDPEDGQGLGDSDRLFVTIFNPDLTSVVKATERVDQVDSNNGIAGASLTAFDGGGFLVSFARKPTTAANGFESEIYTRTYDNTYTAVGGENRVTMNDDPNSDDGQYLQDGGPSVVVTSPDGDATIVWTQTRIGTSPFDFGDEEVFGVQLNNLDPNPPAANTAPTQNNNTGSSLAEGGTDTITAAELDFNDAEEADTAITYTVTNATDNGAVRLNGNATTTFTQDDINNGNVTYLHNGGETTSDQFTFSVSDGTDTVTGQTYDFTVAPQNDDPTATGIPASLTVEEDVTTGIDLSGIQIADTDLNPGNLQVRLVASEGILEASIAGPGSTITINGTLSALTSVFGQPGFVTYTGATNDNGAPGATITVLLNDNGNNGAGGGTFVQVGVIDVNITPVDDAAIAVDDALAVLENGNLSGVSIFGANPGTADSDVDSPLVVTQFNGQANLVGSLINVAGGATVQLNSDGTFDFNTNGAYAYLTAGSTATNSFTYQLNGDDTATVTVTINGVAGDGDVFTGTPNSDTLIANTGINTLIGLASNDTYSVDQTGDIVVEAAAEGSDVVYSTATYTLPVNVEALILQNGEDLDATGNAGDNQLFGNAGDNVINGGGGKDQMSGSGGNDTYIVDSSDDSVLENAGEGYDTVQSSVDWGLAGNIEALELTGSGNLNASGNDLANTITGNSGNNNLDGGAGTDLMIGGAGNDTYRVDNSGDIVTEMAGGGTDAVFSSVDYILASEVESLFLTGTAVSGTGNALSNAISGNDAVNVLNGGEGSDYMLGAGGDDIFVITKLAGSSVDTIGDFEGAGVAGGDRIGFSAADFGADGTVTQLSQTSFSVARSDGSNAQQFIIGNLPGVNSGLIEDDYYFG